MIRVGLVGFGLAGRVFHAPLIASVEGYELVSVVERSTEEAASRYPGVKIVRSLEELLADPTLDLIVLATPGSTHHSMARQVLAAGKHVVVDKPMALSSADVADLEQTSKAANKLAIPFQNSRWDSDFRTLQKVIAEGTLDRLVHLESRLDRWRPGSTRKAWKNTPDEGGILYDLGSHLIDQSLILFGKPLAVSAEVDHERDGEGANDSFTVRLRYPQMRVTLASNLLSAIPGSRFSLRGTKGGFRKHGKDTQEAALSKITHIDSPTWGHEHVSEWGTLYFDIDGGMETMPVESVPGDYRQFYIKLREALRNNAAPPTTAIEAWRTARVLEWAQQSANERREVACDWSGEPA